MNDYNLVNDIRSKLDIVEIISSYLPLVQKGKNFFGVCPFHDDTNPSMSVSREKQIYRCFSCGASGNVFNFVMNYEHLSFPETLSNLANKAGIDTPQLSVGNKKEKYQKLFDIYELAEKYYQNTIQTNIGKAAKNYLFERQISDEVIKYFGIGLSSSKRDDLTDILQKKGYDIESLNKIGLTNQDHDVYVNRIMFPLYDISGKIVGFSGRIYDGSTMNKYVNTKETPIFKKGQMLYHYSQSKDSVRTKKSVIVMEGFMDVIRAYTIGVTNTVALMGTAMTTEQINLLKRLSPNIILCLDGDEPGQNATLKNGEYLENHGLKPKVIELFDNLDPDTYILKYGKESFIALIDNAINFKDYKIKSLKKSYNLTSDEEKTSYIHSVINEASLIDDEIRREIIMKNLAIECNISYNTLEKRLQTVIENNSKTVVVKEQKEILTPVKKRDKYAIAPLAVLYYMLDREMVIRYYDREGIYFPEERQRFLASEISYYYRKYGNITVADFYTYLQEKEELLPIFQEILSINLDDTIKDEVVFDYIEVVKENNKNQEIKRLENVIRSTVDPLEKAKIADKIRMLKIGS